jgi:hypothetical protein
MFPTGISPPGIGYGIFLWKHTPSDISSVKIILRPLKNYKALSGRRTMLANLNISELDNKTMLELYQIARDINLIGYSKLRKKELVFEITKALTHSDELLQAQGVLEIMPDFYHHRHW